MKKTQSLLKSIIDGVLSYILLYAWYALYIYVALKLMAIENITYWQCLGGVILLRQMMACMVLRNNIHIKDKEANDN